MKKQNAVTWIFFIWDLNRPLAKPLGLVQEMAHDPANKVHSMLVLVSHEHCVQDFDHFIAIQLGTELYRLTI